MYQLLKNNDYQDYLKFKQKLKQYCIFNTGCLTIGICSNTKQDFVKYFNTMPIEKILKFKSYIGNGTAGNTYTYNPINIDWLKNVCIYLNIDMIKSYSSWKDSLSHELIYFVQRISNTALDNNLNGNLITAFELNQDQYEKLSKLFSNVPIFNKDNLIYYWGNMLTQTLKLTELKTTTQNILNGFQRMYQQQYIQNNKPKYKHFGDSLQKRDHWLKTKLDQINSVDYFVTDKGKQVLEQFFNSSYQKLYSDWMAQKKFKDSVLIMQYLGIKNCIQNLNIDQRLKNHFKTFKFRDN